MLLITSPAQLRSTKNAVALGNFYALHIGHKQVIDQAVNYAKAHGIPSLAQIFDRPPAEVISGDKDAKAVNSLDARVKILESWGVELLTVEEFTPAMMRMPPEVYVSEHVIKRFNAAAVFAGENFRFGFRGAGDISLLGELCRAHGAEVAPVPLVKLDETVSSTRIRAFIEAGDMETANKYLGRAFSLTGEVLRGAGRGRELGFPTANMAIPQKIVSPESGVYITGAGLGGRRLPGVTNVGAKPTVGVDSLNIETHVIGLDEDLYGKKVEIFFYKKIREIKKFGNTWELKSQVGRDIEKARHFFGTPTVQNDQISD